MAQDILLQHRFQQKMQIIKFLRNRICGKIWLILSIPIIEFSQRIKSKISYLDLYFQYLYFNFTQAIKYENTTSGFVLFKTKMEKDNCKPSSKYSFSFLAPLHKFTKKSNGKGNIKAAMFNYIDQWKQGGLAQKTFVRNIKSATVFFIIGISNTRKKMVRT